MKNLASGNAIVLLLSVGVLFSSCQCSRPRGGLDDTSAFNALAAPDYSDTAMWYINLEDTDNTAADVFYICSTEVGDWQDADGNTIHFADVTNAAHRNVLLGEMQGVNERIGGCNFYAPYYREATMEGLLADTLNFVPRCLMAMADVQRAFDYYICHYNNGRPFVLMGYSQGAYDVVEILRHMPDSLAGRLVAAYVIGYKVLASDLEYPCIKPATGADDTGVTVCYNSVRTPECEIPVISRGTVLGINPANWSVSNEPAMLCDTLTAVLDTASHLVCISNFSGPNTPIPFVGVEGNYHTQEIRFYGPELQQNVLLRAKAWRGLAKQKNGYL